MLLKPKNKSEFAQQVLALPPEKRRVVVFGGRHLNEDSRNLAVRHHEEWEKHGAVTVLIPAAWTPHGFWRDMERKAKEKGKPVEAIWRTVNRKARAIPYDEDLMDLLQKHQIYVPIINLHGATASSPSLEIMVNENAPQWIKNAVTTHQPNEPDFNFRVEDSRSRAETANQLEILIEHHIPGIPTGARSRHSSKVAHEQLDAKYLTDNRATRESLTHFRHRYNPVLTLLIKKLANGIKKRGESAW